MGAGNAKRGPLLAATRHVPEVPNIPDVRVALRLTVRAGAKGCSGPGSRLSGTSEHSLAPLAVATQELI